MRLKHNVMLDLETMSLANNAAITSIGAVLFDETGIHKSIHIQVRLSSSIKHGLHVDGDTVMWWLNQTQAARDSLIQGSPIQLQHALADFNAWLPSGDFYMWGNGAAFDNVILRTMAILPRLMLQNRIPNVA